MAFLTLRHLTQVAGTVGPQEPAISSKLSAEVQAVQVTDDQKRGLTIQPFSTASVFDLRNSPSYDATTDVAVFNPVAASTSRWRLSWDNSGAPLQFRTPRALGVDATTVLSLVRQGDAPFMTLATVSGTPLSTAAVQVGDSVLFAPEVDGLTPPVNTAVAGKYLRVVAKTASTIDVRDDDGLPDQSTIALGPQYAEVLEVLSATGAQVGDTLRLGQPFLPGNTGEFTVTLVASSWVEFSSTSAVSQLLTLLPGSVEVYDEVYDLVSLVVDGPVTVVTLGGESEIALLGGLGVYSATARTPLLRVRNDGPQPVVAQVLFLRGSGGC